MKIKNILAKPWDDSKLIQEIRNAFRYFDSMRLLKTFQCDICNKKGSSEQIQMHHSYYMCARCRNWYELLPGVAVKSLRRLIIR